jgi:pyruvate formate lyase activating enzyme
MKEAMCYEALEGGKVHCYLCAHHCKLKDGQAGICQVRFNKGGKLYTMVFGRVIAKHLDPIEKKPFFHVLPGTLSYSIATVGCNFQCSFCQNWQISQFVRSYGGIPGEELSPERAVFEARESGARSIAYTYTEPTIFFEYAYEIAKLATKEGIINVFVTNGHITPEAVREISPYLHAANIDLKSFNDKIYRKIMKGSLRGVLEGIEAYLKHGVWVEITTLVVPNQNDSEEELREIARYIASLSKDIPWHISRFYPDFKMTDRPPTPIATLRRAYEIGKEEGLKFVYLGNVPGDPTENTYCPNCGKIVLGRWGYTITENNLRNGKCSNCGEEIPGLWTTSPLDSIDFSHKYIA